MRRSSPVRATEYSSSTTATSSSSSSDIRRMVAPAVSPIAAPTLGSFQTMTNAGTGTGTGTSGGGSMSYYDSKKSHQHHHHQQQQHQYAATSNTTSNNIKKNPSSHYTSSFSPPPAAATAAFNSTRTSSVESFLRKSAIQDVIKAFQCKDATTITRRSDRYARSNSPRIARGGAGGGGGGAGRRRYGEGGDDEFHVRSRSTRSKAPLDNSLLMEESAEESIKGAFRPFPSSSFSSAMDSDSNGFPPSQPWNNHNGWFAKPVLNACRGGDCRLQDDLDHEDFYYRGDDDDAFLNAKKESYSAWEDDNAQDWDFQNDVLLNKKQAQKQKQASTTTATTTKRLLDPSPRDSDPRRQSPHRRREQRLEKHDGSWNMEWEVEKGKMYLYNTTVKNGDRNDGGDPEVLWDNHDNNDNAIQYHYKESPNIQSSYESSPTSSSSQGRHRQKDGARTRNENLLDKSLSLEEEESSSSPRSMRKTVKQMAESESTVAAPLNPSLSPRSSMLVLHEDERMRQKQSLTNVRMKLFLQKQQQQQQQYPSVEMDMLPLTKGENGEERLEQVHNTSIKDAKSPLKPSGGPPITDQTTSDNNDAQTDNGENHIEKQSQVSLIEENDFLRRQLIRYKALLLDHEKLSKNEPCSTRSETSSTISSESGSSKTVSTILSQSEAIRLKAQNVNLKASLSEKEAELDKVKEAYEQIDQSQKAQIQQLRGKLKDYKSKAEYGVLEVQMSAMQKSVDLYKDQLEESEEYIKELEKTIDQQLEMWQEEEEAFRKEVDALREQSRENAKYKELCGTAQSEAKKLKKELLCANREIKELRVINDTLDNNLQSANMKGLAKESAGQHEETVRILQAEKVELERELHELKTNMENLRDQSMSVEFENKQEIKKLKEELNHAAFRVQVMRNESPKRKRQEGSNVDSEESTVARLMDQLKEADRKTEEAWASKKKVEESLAALEAKQEESTRKSRAEIDALSRKLSEARSRSRRIAVKSEEELSKIRESERELRKRVNIYEDQSSELRQRLAKLQHQYSDELSSRKRIESALRNEISILRQDKVSTNSSTSVKPHSVNLNSNRVGNELKNLVDKCSTLQSSVEPITKAKQKIGKDMLKRVVANVDELATVVRKIEVAVEEDKLQIENAFSIYESAVTSYEKQIKSLQQSIKVSKDELATCTQQRLESAKKAKQAEMDLNAKLNNLKVQLANVQDECHQHKEEIESTHHKDVTSDNLSNGNSNYLELVSFCELETSTTEAVEHHPERAEATNLRLDEVEESRALSIVPNNSDLISIHSKSNTSGTQIDHVSDNNQFCPTTEDIISVSSNQASTPTRNNKSDETDESWKSGLTCTYNISKSNYLSNDHTKEINNGAQNHSHSTSQSIDSSGSTEVDGDTSLGSQHDDESSCYDNATQASI
mmetsp:Transcript_3823/g.7325  ORF Transcript_3823/g.7325 Transcript_3823/m.7325 type:complete len:1408 (-) Transcript_3823:70-4293(-)